MATCMPGLHNETNLSNFEIVCMLHQWPKQSSKIKKSDKLHALITGCTHTKKLCERIGKDRKGSGRGMRIAFVMERR